MNSKCLAPLAVLLLLSCAREAPAQPTCFVNYDISYPCNYPLADIIFVGRVSFLIDMHPADPKGNSRESPVPVISGSLQGQAYVVVDTLLKGELGGQVELAFRSGCWGTIEVGKQYIFNVRRTTEGLFADRWSRELETLRKDDLTYYMEMYRSFLKGQPQPRLFGTLRHWSSAYPYQAGEPIPDVTVVALKSGAKFQTRTDADGRYEFRELPDGEYQVYPLLPESLRPPDDDYTKLPRERHKETASVTNQFLCGARRDFLAWDNGVIAGRVEDADGKPITYHQVQVEALRRRGRDKDSDGRLLKWVRVTLVWLIDKNLRQGAPYPANEVAGLKDGEFVFVNLPPGPYRLEFVGGEMGSSDEGPGNRLVRLNYPGDVPGKTDAAVINLAPGQKVRDIVIRLPFPSKQ